MNVLVTGGAGFIGTHLVRRLLREGCSTAVLDNFNPQVHAGVRHLAPDVADHVELYRGDVTDRELLAQALEGRDVVVHLAAETGTGQSMYEVARYQDVNIGGTATLIDCIVNKRKCRVGKVLVASSRAIYGEGKYRCEEHGIVYPGARIRDHLVAGQYEPVCPVCNLPCCPEATAEDAPAHPLSFYGLTKYVQEEMVLMFGRAHGFSTHALRYQNVFGPGQSLRNPYTGILAIFSTLARSNTPIQVFEDGLESRDFVFVEDAVDATWRLVKGDCGSVHAFNVGTGQPTTVLKITNEIVQFFGSKSPIVVTGAFREGDIRHNFADISSICTATGFTPQCAFRSGLKKFLTWAAAQDHPSVQYESSLSEMRERGLFHG